jgi:hypothetical protein
VDALWKQHTAHRPQHRDPVKHFPIEIVECIFSFAVYHVEDLEVGRPWSVRWCIIPSSQIIAGYREAPLLLTSVSRAWCQIAINYPPLWSTILVDQSEDDYLERIQLFLDNCGQELLDIILLFRATPTLRLKDFLTENSHRIGTLVGVLADDSYAFKNPFRLEDTATSTDFMNWGVFTPSLRRISTTPIPKCLRRVELRRSHFDSGALIQFTHFHNLESLSISIEPDSINTLWDKKLRFEVLRRLCLQVSYADWSEQFSSDYPWIEWLECPALVDLDLTYQLNKYVSNAAYVRLEACLLRFKSLRNLRVHIDSYDETSQVFDASEFQHMQRPTFNGRLELVQLTFDQPENLWTGAFTERFFSVFLPNTHLEWPYGRFPLPTIFTNLKTMRISHYMEGDESALVATGMTELVFPFLEELYLEYRAPELLDLVRAPCLASLRISWFIPSDLRPISHSTLSSIHLKFTEWDPGVRAIYLPSADKILLDISMSDLLDLYIHPSQYQSVTINFHYREEILCPLYWVADYVSETLGTVTNMKVAPLTVYSADQLQFRRPSRILSFLKPFVYLKHLALFWDKIGEFTCVDQLAQHLVNPTFLPELEALSISEYPVWSDFFQCIQQRQIGFLTGQFKTALKEITIMGPVHGTLLEHLRESLAGIYIGPFNMPPLREGSKEWPMQPFGCRELDTSGLLCCYVCHKAGLEIACMISPSEDAQEMLMCDKYQFDRESNTIFAP